MATRKTAKSRKPASKFRASWKGYVRFGLVSFEVQAINAENKQQSEIHFHLLHKPDQERIHYAKICPKHGEVPNDEIVQGYEYTKNRYIPFEKEELDMLRTEEEKSLSIDAFVSSDEIDPIYFDGRMYYLIPSGSNAAEPYTLLQAAMEKKRRWGIGQVVFSGKEQLAVIRPVGNVLSMAMLNYDAEIRKPSEIDAEFTRPRMSLSNLRLAEDLIAKWQNGKINFSSYKDRYREKVKAAIAKKKKGGVIEAPKEESEPEVINLMDALKKSIQDVRIHKRHAKGKRGTPKRKKA